jgi:hypothetical protein
MSAATAGTSAESNIAATAAPLRATMQPAIAEILAIVVPSSSRSSDDAPPLAPCQER